MVRTRLTTLLLTGSLALSAGCQTSLSDRPMFQRFFGNRCCEDACCPEEGGELIYDGPAMPEGGPILPGGTLTPPTPLMPTPPPPTATPQPPLRPQAQPQPYTPSQVRR